MRRLCLLELLAEENREGDAVLDEARLRRGIVASLFSQTASGSPKKLERTNVLYCRNETVSGGEFLWHEMGSHNGYVVLQREPQSRWPTHQPRSHCPIKPKYRGASSRAKRRKCRQGGKFLLRGGSRPPPKSSQFRAVHSHRASRRIFSKHEAKTKRHVYATIRTLHGAIHAGSCLNGGPAVHADGHPIQLLYCNQRPGKQAPHRYSYGESHDDHIKKTTSRRGCRRSFYLLQPRPGQAKPRYQLSAKGRCDVLPCPNRPVKGLRKPDYVLRTTYCRCVRTWQTWQTCRSEERVLWRKMCQVCGWV